MRTNRRFPCPPFPESDFFVGLLSLSAEFLLIAPTKAHPRPCPTSLPPRGLRLKSLLLSPCSCQRRLISCLTFFYFLFAILYSQKNSCPLVSIRGWISLTPRF